MKKTMADMLKTVTGLRYVVEMLDTASTATRRFLLALPFITDADTLENRLEVADAFDALQDSDPRLAEAMRLNLMQVKDISGSISALRSGAPLDDVELFEIKALCLPADALRSQLAEAGISEPGMPDLSPVINLLDPDGRRIPHFYVYDSYHPELATLRNRLKAIAEPASNPEAEKLFILIEEIEDEVRRELAGKLRPYADVLERALRVAATVDILIASARLKRYLGLARPVVGKSVDIQGLFNPEVAAALSAARREYQPIDLRIPDRPVLVTGSNMTGKSVSLKTVALAQALFQLGFHVPAKTFTAPVFDDITLLIGDSQSELTGLSSYASEILNIDRLLRRLDAGERVLALIDEPARTTNPVEGRAIVSAIIERLAESGLPSIVTTHYDNVAGPCRRMRVKGLSKAELPEGLEAADLNRLIDYSLVDADGSEAPREALRIASILGVSPKLLEKARKHLTDNDINDMA